MSKDFKKAQMAVLTSLEKFSNLYFLCRLTTILAREIGPAAFGIVALVIVFEYVFLYLMMDMGLTKL